MTDHEDLRAGLRRKAGEILGLLSPPEREALLIKNWMSHDARWFMEVANRLNQTAAHEVGKAEAQRLARALGLPPAASLDDYLLAQEVFISLLGPDLLHYDLTKVGDNAFRVEVQRCFAHDNAARAGISDTFECGIFARLTGWLDALGLAYELNPPLGKCLKAQGRECRYTITLVI